MNKDGHILNGALLAIGLGFILAIDPTSGAILAGPDGSITVSTVLPVVTDVARTIVELSVPVTLGALAPDIDTAFGRHRKTLHNLPILGVFIAFPYLFGNLQFVWIGVATHYLLDMVGSKRGIALFYPFSSAEYQVPTGVATSSDWATKVTVLVTALELAVLAAVHYYLFALDTSLIAATETFQTALGM